MATIWTPQERALLESLDFAVNTTNGASNLDSEGHTLWLKKLSPDLVKAETENQHQEVVSKRSAPLLQLLADLGWTD